MSSTSSDNGVGAKPEANVAPVERLLYGRKEAAIALSTSVRRIDYALAFGAFETRRDGSRVLITARSLKRWANTNHYGPVKGPKPDTLDLNQDKAA